MTPDQVAYWEMLCDAEDKHLPIHEDAKTPIERAFSAPKHPFRNPAHPPWRPL